MASYNRPLTYHSTILNWNASGLKLKLRTFCDFLSRHNISIACVTETHLAEEDKIRVPGYNVYRCDRPVERRAAGGVPICVRRGISHGELFLPALQRLEGVAVQVEVEGHQSIRIVSAYQKPNSILQNQDIAAIFDGSPTLLIGDLNSKNQLWGCRVNNSNGRRLLELTDQLGIVVSAPEEMTFYPSQFTYQPDILDICLTQNINIPITQTALTELDSDHLPVLITFNRNFPLQQPLGKLIQGHINWEGFRFDLHNKLNIPTNYRTTKDIDEAVDTLTNLHAT